MEVKTAISSLRKSAHEAIDNGAPVTAPELPVGRAYAQGDLAVVRIKDLPSGAKPIEWVAQMAPGNTKGSRHCLLESEKGHVTLFRHSGDMLSDLSVETTAPWTLTHPEHADITFGPGLYQIIHQQNENLERVRD